MLLGKKALRSLLDASIPVYHPDTPLSLSRAVSRAYELHSRSESRLGVEATETSSESKARIWFKSALKRLSDGQYHVRFGGGSNQTFESDHVWVGKYPTLLTSLQNLQTASDVILDEAEGSIVMVSSPPVSALVLDTYCGYLPGEPNPDEVVYELTTWSGDT